MHDGSDYLNYASAKTVLDNLIHRLDVAEVVAAFIDPGDRLARVRRPRRATRDFVTKELVPQLESELPLLARPAGRCLMGSSFGGVAALVGRDRVPRASTAPCCWSPGSFVFTDIGNDHGGGPVFDPVVSFVNRFRAAPPPRRRPRVRHLRRVRAADRAATARWSRCCARPAWTVRFVEARDGHNWENWRDRLRDGLSWIFPARTSCTTSE